MSGIEDRPGHYRPAQVCALSAREMREALRHAGRERHPTFVIVTHSFEMLSRDRRRPNRNVMSRFVSMCWEIANNPELQSSGFNDLDERILEPLGHPVTRLGPDAVRTSLRIAEQAMSNWMYERQIMPAWRATT